jgi:hypothetical protein
VLLGIKLKWKLTLVKTIAIIGFLTFVLMSVVFPFAGSRGGMFHSSAGIQPFVWAVSAAGLQVFIAWGERKRGWEQKRAEVMFGALLVTVAVGLTVFSLLNRVIGNQWNQSVWNESDHYHHLIAQELNELEAESTDLVMLNNPPGYYATTGRSAVVIPNGGITETLLAAERYDVLFLVLDKNHPPQLNDVYQQPEEYQQLTYLGTTAEIHFFRFNAGIIDD